EIRLDKITQLIHVGIKAGSRNDVLGGWIKYAVVESNRIVVIFWINCPHTGNAVHRTKVRYPHNIVVLIQRNIRQGCIADEYIVQGITTQLARNKFPLLALPRMQLDVSSLPLRFTSIFRKR